MLNNITDEELEIEFLTRQLAKDPSITLRATENANDVCRISGTSSGSILIEVVGQTFYVTNLNRLALKLLLNPKC